MLAFCDFFRVFFSHQQSKCFEIIVFLTLRVLPVIGCFIKASAMKKRRYYYMI